MLLLQYVLVQFLLHPASGGQLVFEGVAERVGGDGFKVGGVVAASWGGVAALAHAGVVA